MEGAREPCVEHGLELIRLWAQEIHGRFSARAYRVVTTVLPKLLLRLIVGRDVRQQRKTQLIDPRLKVRGDLELLRELSEEATLILVPTHLSNLDSPLIGWALHLVGLPPFVYGAGLNLFSNKVMGWWMSRLGAYTVDRTKRAKAYKVLLKDYSVWCLTTRHHSLFFPGGTRARSGRVEEHLKKGLLGTGLTAWQEMLDAGNTQPDVYVVPLTMTFQMVLEASTLIEDHLAEEGKQRYIITDDEFAQPQTVLSFARRVLALDSAIVMDFGQPLDVMGQPVPADKREREEASVRRRGYVCGLDGHVEYDEQRDRVYTERLAASLCDAYRRGTCFMSTHVVAAAAWKLLERSTGARDPYRVFRIPIEGRRLEESALLDEIERLMVVLRQGEAEQRWTTDLPKSAAEALATALDRFGRYHQTRVIRRSGRQISVDDPKLCFYYRNRLSFVETV